MDLRTGAARDHFHLSAEVRCAGADGVRREPVLEPWNTLPEHRPLGGINRARKLVYEDSSALRHKTTGKSPVIPTGREWF